MEGSLKGAYQHGVRRQLLKLADGLQIRFIVGGSHHHVIFHALEHIGSQFMDAVVALGKNGLEAYPLQLGQASQHAVFCVQNIVQKKLNAFRIGGNGEVFLKKPEPSRLGKMIDSPAGAHTFYLSFCQYGLRGHVKEFEFQGSAPCVAY